MARDLYQAAALAVRQGYSSPEERREVEALADIRDHIQNLETKVRQAKTTVDEAAKALVRRILDWCELKKEPNQQHATRSSADDVPRSTDGMVTAALTNPLSISDVSSGWVQSQARSTSRQTFSMTDWETKSKLSPAKAAAAAASSSSLSINTAGSGGSNGPRSPSRRSPNRRAALSGAGSGFDAEQQQQQGWRVGTEVAQQQQLQQGARQVRQPRAFLHLDGAGDASLTSSGGYGLSANSSAASLAEQSDTVVIGGTRRYTADDDAFEPAVGASSGWEAVGHLRQQHPAMRTSLRTSGDISHVLRHSNINIKEAAYLSSMASQVHILHDAVAQKPQGPDGLPAVPVVPPILAVRKKQRWWVGLLKMLAGTAGAAALVGAVAFAAGQSLPEGSWGADSAQSSKQQQQRAGAPLKQQQMRTKQQQQAATAQEQKQQQAAGMPRLPYVPVGPAPSASAACG
ncbi:hypothetical protein OEZ86_009790 [Tetradesmus obliquus]|nr:hypothetical protein OEZ86_009790 [Tetradesmus obliquus]